MLGGDPVVYVSSTDHLEGRGLDEPVCDGRALREFCYARGGWTGIKLLADFCMSPSAMGQRVLLVPRLSEVSPIQKISYFFLGTLLHRLNFNVELLLFGYLASYITFILSYYMGVGSGI